jgi:hypothetical protein
LLLELVLWARFERFDVPVDAMTKSVVVATVPLMRRMESLVALASR